MRQKTVYCVASQTVERISIYAAVIKIRNIKTDKNFKKISYVYLLIRGIADNITIPRLRCEPVFPILAFLIQIQKYIYIFVCVCVCVCVCVTVKFISWQASGKVLDPLGYRISLAARQRVSLQRSKRLPNITDLTKAHRCNAVSSYALWTSGYQNAIKL